MTDGPVESAALDLVNDRDAIDAFETRLLAAIDRFGYPKASRFAIRLAAEEAVMNAFNHGHKGLPASTPVHVSYEVSPDRVVITVEDQGPGFTPAEVADPTLDENLEVPTGRGLMLMRAYATEVRHNATGNRVEMVYTRPDDDDA